ncbi:hypothetical protein NFJ02_29g69590 [Pycnococcus provasolii]
MAAALSRDSRRDQRDSAVSLRVRPAVDDDDDAGRRDDDDDLPSYPLSDAQLLTHSHTRRANQEEEDVAAGVRLEPIQGAIALNCARIAGEKQMRVTNENLAKTVRAAPQWTLIASRLTRMAIPPTTSYNRQPKGQVIRDSEARLFNFGFLFLLRGTVLQSWFYWTQLASLIGISVVALIISYFYSSPFHCHSKHCAEFHEYRWNQRDFVQVYEDLDLLEIIVSVMTIMLVPEYVASLYLRFTVNIWWTLRFKTLQELMNVASSMAQHASFVHGVSGGSIAGAFPWSGRWSVCLYVGKVTIALRRIRASRARPRYVSHGRRRPRFRRRRNALKHAVRWQVRDVRRSARSLKLADARAVRSQIQQRRGGMPPRLVRFRFREQNNRTAAVAVHRVDHLVAPLLPKRHRAQRSHRVLHALLAAGWHRPALLLLAAATLLLLLARRRWWLLQLARRLGAAAQDNQRLDGTPLDALLRALRHRGTRLCNLAVLAVARFGHAIRQRAILDECPQHVRARAPRLEVEQRVLHGASLHERHSRLKATPA